MKTDIADRIRADFHPEEVPEAIGMLETAGQCEGRLARCIVVASNGSLETLRKYIEMAEVDSRDVIVAGEYEPGLRQVRDLRASFLIDAQEKFWIGEVAAALYARGYILQRLVTRRAAVGPFNYTADEGEGVAEFNGDPTPITIKKSDRRWTMSGDPGDLELYNLNQSFEDEDAFRDAISCYVFAKQKTNQEAEQAAS